jgi:hypothetical protein
VLYCEGSLSINCCTQFLHIQYFVQNCIASLLMLWPFTIYSFTLSVGCLYHCNIIAQEGGVGHSQTALRRMSRLAEVHVSFGLSLVL